jgi:hypothetical protein
MKSLIQGFLTGMRGQARVLAPSKVISPRFSRHLNTPREISPLWERISDTLNPHSRLFPGRQDRHPGLASGCGGCSHTGFWLGGLLSWFRCQRLLAMVIGGVS